MFRRNKKSNGAANGSHQQEEGVVYYDGSKQQQQQQVLYHDDRHDPQSAYQDQQQQVQQQQGKNKKNGFGARIRGIVRRKKRRGTNGDDGGESVGSHDVSSYDAPSQQEQQDDYEEDSDEETMEVPLNDLPNSALDPNIMSRIVEEEEEESDDDDNGQYSRGGVVKAKSNHMISKKARELPMDSMVNDDDISRGPSQVSFKDSPKKSSKTAPKATPSVVSLDTGSLSLVVLLVDPATMRFELLQVDFPKPKDATVADILEQIQDPFWRPLPFVGVIDRQGNAYKVKKQSQSKSPKRSFFKKQQQNSSRKKTSPSLEQACNNRPPRKSRQEPHRDVLVGLLRDSSVEKTRQLARPVLGETKVVALLERQGYSLDGWKQDKQREATLQQSRSLSNNKRSKQSWYSSLPRPIMALLVIAAVMAVMIVSGKVAPESFDPRNWNVMSSTRSMPSLRDKLPNTISILDKFRSNGEGRSVGKPKKEAPAKLATPLAAPLVSVSSGEDTNTKEDL